MRRLAEIFSGRRAYALLFAAALALRIGYCWEQSQRNPLFDFPVVDARMYADWAAEMAGGKWLWTELHNYHPAYPAFLALCKLFLFGGSPWAVKAAQSLLGAAAAVMLAAAAARLLGRRAGLAAGWLFAGTWMFVLYDAELFSESLCVSALAACLLALVRLPQGWTRALAAGAAGALAVACRPNLALFVPAAAAALLFWPSWPGRRAWLHLAAFGAVFVLVFFPVLLRNHQLGEGWVLRTQQNWNVYAALEPDFGGLHPAAGIAFDRQMRRPLRDGCGDSHAQIERYWAERTRELLRTRPAAVAWNYFAVRGLVFLNRFEWSQEFDVYASRACSRLLSLPLPGFGWAFPLACAGLLWLWREHGAAARLPGAAKPRFDGVLLLTLLLLAAAAATFPFKVTGRYRLPVLLFLLPFAGAALDRAPALLRERRFRAAAAGAAVFLAAGAVCWPDWTDLRHRWPAPHEFYAGLKYRRAGEWAKAEAAFRAETARLPQCADAPHALAGLLLERGRPEEALAAAGEALRREPEFWKAWNTRGRIALELKQYGEALRCADRSLALLSCQPEPWLVRRAVFGQTGDWKAEDAASRAAIRAGAGPAFVLEYGLRLEEKGFLQEALDHYGAVVEDAALPHALRARGCLLAGHLFARRFRAPDRAAVFWRRAAAEFADAELFADQARYLAGALPEDAYRKNAAATGSPAADGYCAYNRALRRRLDGDAAGADAILRELLRTPPPDAAALPWKWAAEDLAASAAAAKPARQEKAP